MADRSISGFKLSSAVVVCPECGSPFQKELLTETPPLSAEDVVEADLHRVFPDPCIRASLLGLCPECKFCGWSTSFGPSNLNPLLARKEATLPHTKKYAVAVKCARSRNVHPLDIAFIALNGLWCAREAGEDDLLWLELVAYEHSRGMQDYPSVENEDGMAHLMMGEIWRQLKQFDQARREYELALKDATIMPEIIRHQIGLCDRKVDAITALPLHIVRQIFDVEEPRLDEPPLEDAAQQSANNSPAVSPAPVKVNAVAQQPPATDTPAAAPKMTAETAMLSAISSLLSAQASLLAEEALEEKKESPAAEVQEEISKPSVIRPARPRAKEAVAEQPAVPPVAAPVTASPTTAAAVVAPMPQAIPTPAAVVAPAPQAAANTPVIAQPEQSARAVTPFPQGNPGMVQVQPITQPVEPAQPVIAAPPAPPKPPAIRHPEGIARIKNGNSIARVRHSHKFKHALVGPPTETSPGWFSDYAPTPERLPAQFPGEQHEMLNPYYEGNQQAALPDFEIAGFTKTTEAARRRAAASAAPAAPATSTNGHAQSYSQPYTQSAPQPVAPQQPQQAQQTQPAKPAAANSDNSAAGQGGQSADHTDAIARVESYLSFSRALHTRSFLKYN